MYTGLPKTPNLTYSLQLVFGLCFSLFPFLNKIITAILKFGQVPKPFKRRTLRIPNLQANGTGLLQVLDL